MMKKPLYGLLSAFLTLSLTGCGYQQTKIVIHRDLPPDLLLIDTPIPAAEGRRNGDLMNWANSLRCALVQANADKAAIRAWKAGAAYTPDNSACE